MKRFEIKGKDADEKLKNLERVIQRIARRTHRTFVGLVPSSPVFGFVADPVEKPVVMQVIFPADGTITKGAIYFGRMKSKAHYVDVLMESVEGSVHYSFPIPKKGDVSDFGYPVKAGTRMTVSVLDPDETVGDVWVGFMYELAFDEMNQLRIPFDYVEKLAEEALDAS